MISFHPVGFTHGPHPKALQNAFQQKAAGTEEVAVMIDTRDSLAIDAAANAIEWAGYVDSWQTRE
jgi:homogentisate 1,2-dioxygenase